MQSLPLTAARESIGKTKTTFRPPATLVRAVAPRAAAPSTGSSLAAGAKPYVPSSALAATTAAKTTGGPKPPAPLALASTPPSGPLAAGGTPPPALDVSPPHSSLQRPPAATTSSDASLSSVYTLQPPSLTTSKTIITPEAIESGVYTIDMFVSLRRDCCNTPLRVLNWAVDHYKQFPMHKTPAHLVLTVREPTVDEEADARSGLGSLVRSRRPLRTVKAIHQKVMSILSRLAPSKFAELQKELNDLPLKQTNDEELKQVVSVFFEKAVMEQTYSGLYAKLISELCTLTDAERHLEKELREKLLPSRLRQKLLTKCQEEFERPLQLSEDDKVDPVTGKRLDDHVIDEKRDRLKNRLIGNIKFVGELFCRKSVTERVVISVFDVLVSDFEPSQPVRKEEYVYEVFATLLKCVGQLVNKNNPTAMSKYMGIVALIRAHHPKPRLQFLMMDLEDRHAAGWETKEKLLTVEDREKELLEGQRRGLEEIDRRLKEKAVSVPTPPAVAPPPPPPPPHVHHHHVHHHHVHHHHHHQPSTPTSAPPHHTQHRPPSLNQMQLPNNNSSGSTTHPREAKHPHGTPTASPAKFAGHQKFGPPPTPTSATSSTLPSPMMTPPPKYQRNLHMNPTALAQGGASSATQSERSPLHPTLPSAGSSQNMLSDSGVEMTRASSTNSLSGYPMVAPHTPISPSAPPMPLQDHTNLMMTQLLTTKRLDDVLMQLRALSLQHRVHCLTMWLRKVATTTKLFDEREQICILFSGLLQSAARPETALISPHDLVEMYLEWIRYDIERDQFENCPRLFNNIGGIISTTYGPGSKNLGSVEDTRATLSCMTFTVLLRELVSNEKFNTVPTLVKDAYPVVLHVLQHLHDAHGADGTRLNLLRAAQNRFRILPFVLHGDGALTRCKTPGTPSKRGSVSNDSISSYDMFSQCLTFARVPEDIEFSLFRKIRESESPSQWRDAAIQLAKESSPSTLSRLTAVMKVVCTLLVCAHPKDPSPALQLGVRGDDVDYVIHQLLSMWSGVEFQAAAVVELIMHFTYKLNTLNANRSPMDSPSKTFAVLNGSLSDASAPPGHDSRLGSMQTIFKRWSTSGIIQAENVLKLLRGIHQGSGSHSESTDDIVASAGAREDLYTVHHNFVTEFSWSNALSMLQS